MINRNHDLDITMLRMSRRKKIPMPQGLGTSVDQYEAQQKELELAIAMLASQSAIERQKAELLKSQIEAQIKTATTQILSFLNSYQKSMFDKIYSQVKISEESLKFKGTDIYDMSFVSNMDYSKITVFNDTKLLESRVDRREEYRQKMKAMKAEVIFADQLIANTDSADDMLPNLYDQKSYFLKQYYLACIAFYQESTVIGFLYNPTNNLENLKEFISYNTANLSNQIKSINDKRLAMGEDQYKIEIERVRYIERLVVTAQSRLKYLMEAYAGKWTPPTFETLTKYAEANDLTYSRAVYELNEKSRQTLCIPDWVLSIAEMYNKIEVFEQGADKVDLNPYDSRWIRKAKEVINLESIGVKHTAEKMFQAINEYWIVLTYGFQELEDYHLEAIIDKALHEDTTAVDYRLSNDFTPINFDEDMQGFLKKAFKSITKPLVAVSKPLVSVTKAVVKVTVVVVKNSAGVLVDASRVVTQPVAKAVKASLDNTLGRVLPDSVYSKISTMTDVGVNIVNLNLDKKTFRMAVKSVVDIALIGPRIAKEIMTLAMKQSLFQDLDKYSGGLLTSANNLANVPITLSKGGKIDWKMVALDALKIGLAIASGGTAIAIMVAVNYAGEKTGLNKTSLGMGVLTAAAMIAAGQATFSSSLTTGATTVGTKSLINSTGLGDSSLGRSIASIGVAAAVGSIQSNKAFTQELRDRAEDKLKAVAKAAADKKLKEISGGLLTTDLISKGVDFYNSDKTIAGIIEEARIKYTEKLDNLIKKAEGLTMEKVMEKAAAEADRFVAKRLDELYGLVGKYGDKLIDYLMKKYGPKDDYDDVIQPDDFLNYQITETLPDQRLFNNTNVVYTKNNAGKAFVAIAAVGGAAYLFLND